jgi:hypothetical protein
MKFDINALSLKLNKVDKELKEIDNEEKIKKYGTFLDSKKEIVQLYILFIFFGIHGDIIQQFPFHSQGGYSMTEYDQD